MAEPKKTVKKVRTARAAIGESQRDPDQPEVSTPEVEETPEDELDADIEVEDDDESDGGPEEDSPEEAVETERRNAEVARLRTELAMVEVGLKSPPTSGAGSILAEADSLINGQRVQDYGSPQQSFDRIASLWSVYLGREVTAFDVANMMMLLKISRAKNGFHRDSYVDIAGYAALTEVLDN